MKTKAIIFDLYNTLIYCSIRKNPHLELFRNIGMTKEEMSFWRDKILTENFSSFEDLSEAIKPGSWDPSYKKYEYQVSEENEHTHVFDDAYSTLEYLSKRYKIYLLSNIATPYKECFYNLGLDKWIKNPYFSCDIGYRKPQSESFNCIIKDSGLQPQEFLMIGDSMKSDYNGALNSGIKAIHKNKSLNLILPDVN